MISHRLRALVAGAPIVLMSTLMLASPALAADALSIAAPGAGASVSGPLLVEGEVAGARAVEIELSLAPQVLGDCGAPAATTSVSEVVGDFRASIPTTGLADGSYCLIAVADGGRLSAVVADITVGTSFAAGEEVDDFQLSTQALGGSGGAAAAAPLPIATSALLGDLPTVGSAVLALAMALAAVVLGTGLWARRRTAE